MPLVFEGTWTLSEDEVEEAVRLYLSSEVGGTAVDAAGNYDNQRGVGRAIQTVPRSQVFIQTKVGFPDPDLNLTGALLKNLEELQVDYVDSVMLHGPPKDPVGKLGACSEHDSSCSVVRQQWKSIADFYNAGKTRAVGVSNFCLTCLACLEQEDIFPMFNQVMYFLGMGLDNSGAMSYAKKHGMILQAYDATGNKWWDDRQGPSDDIAHGALTTGIAATHNKSTIQVALKWLTDQGIPVMVRTQNPDHMRQDLDLFSWSFSDQEIQRLNAHSVAVPPNPVDLCGATGNSSIGSTGAFVTV